MKTKSYWKYWVTEWDKEKLSEKIIDTLDFLWLLIWSYWKYGMAFGSSMFFLWMFMVADNWTVWNITFHANDPVYLIIGLLLPVVFISGFSTHI